jgi:glycosyltransferase involved in cell wall biosynthesis
VLDSDGARDGLRFSVVVPAYNEAAFLEDCLASLASQDFAGSFEVIVIDNNSADQTAEIARSRGATVVNEQHLGVCWARRAGTMVARGEIIVSTDADTTFDPGWLSRIDRTFTASPACVAVAGPCRYRAAPWWGDFYVWVLFLMVHVVHVVTGRVVYVTATNIAFRKSAWTGYDTSATQGGDELDLLRRLRSRGRIAFDLGNPCFTSSRRLRQGLAYNLVVTFLYYYVLGYSLNRLLDRPVVGTAPAFRGTSASASLGHGLTRIALTVAAATVGVAMLVAVARVVRLLAAAA